jgi:NAD(P)-dependent dehydrogenase (short-subunit alcohol dehydrogenase family)
MRVIVIGATGTIGKAVADAFAVRHEVLRASRHGEVKVDIEDPDSIRAMYREVGRVDGVVSCTGHGAFKPLGELTDEDLDFTLRNKLLGQVNLVRHGVDHVSDGGVFLLTAGIFSQRPIPGVPALAIANGGLECFARAAALDLPRGIRINTVSPPFIDETAKKMGFVGGMPAAENAMWYLRLLEGTETGEVVFPE